VNNIYITKKLSKQAEVNMESQTIKFKKVVVGAEEASGSNWLSKLSRPPKALRCSNCKCVVCTHRQPGYATSEEDEEEEDYTVHDYKILTQIPDDTIEDNNVGLHHNHTCCA